MTSLDVLRTLLNGSFGIIQERLDSVSDEEWDERALPSTSKPGFILWHCARIIDWTVLCAIQGRPEIADAPRWRSRFPHDAYYGAGISEAVADEVTASTSRADVREYLAELRTAVMAWFGQQTESTLDAAPPLKANQANRDGYLDPDVWAEVADLDGLQGWQLLLRPSASHIRRHAGEFDVLVGVLRARAGAHQSA